MKLWRRMGLDVHLIPTWDRAPKWKSRLETLGCTTHFTSPEDLERVPGLAGSPVVGLCNSQFITCAPRFRSLGCPIVWVNCMTFLFDNEKEFYQQHDPADAMVCQSEFQRSELEPQLAPFGYRENWPRAGLVAMAAGVAVVAQNEWGWKEMTPLEER